MDLPAQKDPGVFFSTALSPVMTDWETNRSFAAVSRISAGTCLPLSSRTISPGTRNALSISCSLPSRMTIAFGLVSFFSASIALLAFPSWITPIHAFKRITAPMIQASPASFRNSDTTIAAIRI